MANESVKNNATLDSNGGVNFTAAPNVVSNRTPEIVRALQGYKHEAKQNRQNGLNPRDDKWRENLDLYWNRYDFSDKANWQAKETMPEVPSFVDRFAAAMKEALVQTPEGFYSIVDPADTENDMAQAIKRVMDVWLSQVGRNQVGQLLPFAAVFEEQMKLGSIMATSSVTTWKNDVEGGRVAIETVDPQMVWLDHTYRNLYRIRQIELDRHELAGMKLMRDGKNVPIFDLDEISKLEGDIYEKARRDQERAGNGTEVVSSRRPIILDEYIATVIGDDGRVLADRSLMVLANDNYLIRGPEKNPFWHGKDWLTYSPLVTAPLSVYGRSYMEDFGSLARTFTTLTNMLIDAVHMTSMKMYAMVPSMLANPNQIAEGAAPMKLWLLEDGYNAEQFAKALDMGTLDASGVKIWEQMKSELANAAGINEIGLGQFAPNSRTSATEISETQQSSSALIRSVAQTVETRWLDPTLDLVWKTGMQHARSTEPALMRAAGEGMWEAMIQNRRDMVRRPITFQARGISSLISRGQGMRSLMQVLQIMASNPILLNAFMQKIDLNKLLDRILMLSGIDISKISLSERERMIRDVVGASQQVGPATGSAPSAPGESAVNGAVQALGVGR